MKIIPTLLAFVACASAALAQSIPLDELVGPNNAIRDSKFGLSATYPAGWQVQTARRWGKNNLENTIMMQAIWPLTSRPSLYYQPTSNFDRPAPGAEAAHFHYTAGTKAAQRVNNGLKDYRNLADTFTLKTINGRPAFSYVATFTMQGVPHYEYFVRILGTDLIAMFFVQGPVEELETVRREIDQMAATVQLP
jgi:hypothetical protein